MENSLIKVSSNWSHVGGCSFPQAVQERDADPDFFIKPDLNDIVVEEKSILLSKKESSGHCELYVKIYPQHKIQAVSFVCNIVKVEIFHGPIKEYIETVYGVIADETDDEFKSYRYDVEIEKSGVTNLTIRFLTDFSEVCIFGIMLHTSPNPCGITTLSPLNDYFDVQGVRNSITIPDKCEQLFELISKKKQNMKIASEDCAGMDGKSNEHILNNLKSYIDNRFKEIETRIIKNLADMEQRQNKKLDLLLHILENNRTT